MLSSKKAAFDSAAGACADSVVEGWSYKSVSRSQQVRDAVAQRPTGPSGCFVQGIQPSSPLPLQQNCFVASS